MPPSPRTAKPISRNALIASSVLLFHVLAIWVLQTGLLRRAAEVLVPAELLSQIIEPPKPDTPPPAPPPPPPPPPPQRVQSTPPPTATPALPPPPMPVAIADPTPAPHAPAGVATPPVALPPIAAPVAPAPAPPPPAPAPPAPVQAPIEDSDYAPNADLFARPKISQRMNEFGRVVLRVTVGTNGFASKVELHQSSGFERLDNAAINGAKQLKFRPATRAGVPVEWTYLLPVNYAESK